MGLNGPGWSGNAIQPNTATVPVSAAVAAYPVGRNPMAVTWPIPRYVQPDVAPQPVKVGGKLL
jgi:hypothetical protein